MNEMHGWLIIDKPLGLSSAQVVGKVKWLLKNAQKREAEAEPAMSKFQSASQQASGETIKKLSLEHSQSASGAAAQRGEKFKVGHAGTLDPLASGILPLAIGECTKVVQFLTDADKAYEFEVTWGEERSTDDAEGELAQKSDIRPQMSDIEKVMENFKGEIEQIPPQHSAIKVDGKRAYDIARSGEVANIKTRKITIHNIELLDVNESGGVAEPQGRRPLGGLRGLNATKFRVLCSKGTYIRSIARDMGRILGCYGYVSALRRVAHGQFALEHAISLEKLEEMCKKGIEQQAILPVDDVLDDIPELKLSDTETQRIRNGIVLNTDLSDTDLIRLYHDNTLLAIAEISQGKLKTKRVFNL